jgi:hypothetical protein
VLFGSLASGLGALAFQILGLAVLGEGDYQPIVVLWTIQYLSGTVVLYSAEAYVCRALQNDHVAGLDRSVRVIGAWVAAFALLTGALAFGLRGALFHGEADLAFVAAALVASYGGFYVIKGRMAGTNRFRSYGAATALESLGRILIAVPVLALLPTTRALAWVMPLGPALVVAWWLYDRGRTLPPDTDEAAAPQDAGASRFLAATTTANAVSQTLLAAGPLVLIPLGAGAVEVSVFFAVVTAARVPLVFAIGGLLSRIMPPLTRLARAGQDAAMRRIALLTVPVTLALALVAAVFGWLVGPTVLTFVFDITTPERAFVALTAFGVILATGSLLLNQVLIARGSENRMVAPWLAALVAAAAGILLSSGTPTMRASLGFVTGEIVAHLGLLVAVLTAPKLARSVEDLPESELVAATDSLIDP